MNDTPDFQSVYDRPPPKRLDKIPKGCRLVKIAPQPDPPRRKKLKAGSHCRTSDGGSHPLVEGYFRQYAIVL